MSSENINVMPKIEANAIQRWLSYVFPVRLLKIRGDSHKPLKVVLYKGQTQLAYGNVFYSDGLDYFPFRKAFQLLDTKVKNLHNILVLGAGIGSIAMVLDDLFPDQRKQYHFVDIDSTILALCKIHLNNYATVNARYSLRDATEFVQSIHSEYDCICVDVFNEHIVPKQIVQEAFILNVFKGLKNGGYVILNLMFQGSMQQMGFESILKQQDPDFKIISTRNNVIYIARKQ